METIIGASILVGVYCIGYWRGVVSGYNTKLREEHAKYPFVNVVVSKAGDQFLFHDMSDNSFILQDADDNFGALRCMKLFEPRVCVITALTEKHDEPV